MSARRFATLATVCGAVLLAGAEAGHTYALLGPKWPDGGVVMHMQLGSWTGELADGASSWGESAEWALAEWNAYLDRVSFRIVRDSTSPIAEGNRLNSVFWSTSVFGRPFNSGVNGPALAVTTRWTLGSTRTEADVVFNTTYSWNSYRGPLWSGTVRNRTYDFHRVALHELGHVLGLDHPDDYGQVVSAVMNSQTSNVDDLVADDTAGAQALYSISGNGTVGFPPRNESFDFRQQLEAKYRDGLRRPAQATYVDIEGDVVWIQEYLRFRVNQCSHSRATSNVMTEINGGTAYVCGSAPSGTVLFPPRDESLDFRVQLEVQYRDSLGREPSSSTVDNEGDIVWTQEYLRYRVNGCTHADSTNKVFQQIDGLGIAPVCR